MLAAQHTVFLGQMRSASLTKCALQARFLFTNFTEIKEKKEYAEILINVDLHVERSIRII